MTVPMHGNGLSVRAAEAVERSQSHPERTPMAGSVQHRPRNRPHHGATAQQMDALDRLVTDLASELLRLTEHVKALQAALISHGVMDRPYGAPPPPRTRPEVRASLLLVQGGAW